MRPAPERGTAGTVIQDLAAQIAEASQALAHRDPDAALCGHALGDLVAGVHVADDSHARVVGQDTGQLLGGQGRAVGQRDLTGVDRATDTDAAAVRRRGGSRPTWRPRQC